MKKEPGQVTTVIFFFFADTYSFLTRMLTQTRKLLQPRMVITQIAFSMSVCSAGNHNESLNFHVKPFITPGLTFQGGRVATALRLEFRVFFGSA